MKKAKQQAKKRAQITEFPDIEPGARTSSPITSVHSISQEQSTVTRKRPRSEGETSSKELDHLDDSNTQASSIPELSADKDVLARVPKPQVSAFSWIYFRWFLNT